jgi:calpain-7
VLTDSDSLSESSRNKFSTKTQNDKPTDHGVVIFYCSLVVTMSLLDDVFELLETATRLEETGVNRIEAATKYYEAIYLMRQCVQRMPRTAQESSTKQLLEGKIEHFGQVAARLLADDSSTSQSIFGNPRSPVAKHRNGFFNEDMSVITIATPHPADSSPRFTQTAALNKTAGQANHKLATAMDFDEQGKSKEAIAAYMGAAEIYLEAIKIAENQLGESSIKPVLVRRLEGALDRVEDLKHPNPQHRHVVSEPKAKEQNENGGSSLTQEEIAVLKRSSLIASGLFLPWSESEAQALSTRFQQNEISSRPTSLFSDPEGDLPLSEKQRNRFSRWARPSEIAQQRQKIGVTQHAPVLIRTISPYTIRQQYVTDCSFIASLCICAAFENRFRKRLITSIIYPQNKDGIPVYNKEGKYMVKLWLNGVARQVLVDDRLPVDKHSNLLCSHTTGTRNQLELWVTIIEKAYMKLCGGYDFPGSNSGVDLFSLTGWIPERIFFAKDPSKVRDFETEAERAFERLYSANSFGDCLITVSTTRDLTEDQAEALGLVTGHAYAVLDVLQTKNGTRLLQMKNPWASKV